MVIQSHVELCGCDDQRTFKKDTSMGNVAGSSREVEETASFEARAHPWQVRRYNRSRGW